jgi:enamine deaminase RidA (YjgF/YER057c/UK114 family)
MRQRVPTGNPWGDTLGYSRAVRQGAFIFVAGTTATGPDGHPLAPGDPAAQTRIVFERIETALRQLGGSLRDVVDTKIYLTNIEHWPQVGGVHGEVFREVKPAATMLAVTRLIDPGMLVEISAVALLEDERLKERI